MVLQRHAKKRPKGSLPQIENQYENKANLLKTTSIYSKKK